MQRMRRPSGPTLLAMVIVPLGLASLWTSYGPARVADFTPWLVVGWACVACGVASRRVASLSLEGLLLVAVGVTWLLPDVSTCLNAEPLSHRCIDVSAIAPGAPVLRWLWLGLIGHAIVSFPSGRVRSPPVLFAVVAAYALALAVGAEAGPARPLLAVVLILAPLVRSVARREVDAPESVASVVAGATVAATLLLDPAAPYALDLGVVAAPLALLLGLTAIARRQASLTTDRAIELGPALADACLNAGTRGWILGKVLFPESVAAPIALLLGLTAIVRRRASLTTNRAIELGPALAGVLGDPVFSIAVRSLEGDGWLSTSGHPVPPPPTAPASTTIVRDGREVARLIHNGSTLADPDIRTAVMNAAELEAHHVRLIAELDAQVEAIAASRRRLVDAGLHEREALGRQVDVDVMRRLDQLARTVRAVQTDGLAPQAAQRLRQASEGVETAKAEVEELARGVYPAALAELGLVGALRELASAMPIGVRLEAEADARGGPDVEATLYFVCAEALANVARHARASGARIQLTRGDGALTVRIEDDGAGGADLGKGTGLRGLRDRVETYGGALEIDSPPGKGTRLAATIPVAAGRIEP